MSKQRESQTDKLARVTYHETLAIRADLKKGVATLRRDIRRSEKAILQAIRGTNVKATVDELQRDMTNLWSRLHTVEKRLGIEA
jgi:hypothetical protein